MATPFEAAAAEHKGKAPTVEAFGETFQVQDPGAMALVEWAASGDLDTDAPTPAEINAANAAIFYMLEALITDADFQRFRKVAKAHRAKGDELLKVIRDAIAATTGRPTGPPSGSRSEHETNGRPSTDVSPSTARTRRSA